MCQREDDCGRSQELGEGTACCLQAFLLEPSSSIEVAVLGQDLLPVGDLFLESLHPYISDIRHGLGDAWSLSLSGGTIGVVSLWSIPWCSCGQGGL